MHSGISFKIGHNEGLALFFVTPKRVCIHIAESHGARLSQHDSNPSRVRHANPVLIISTGVGDVV